MLQHLLGYILISLYHISNLQCLELEEGSDNEDNPEMGHVWHVPTPRFKRSHTIKLLMRHPILDVGCIFYSLMLDQGPAATEEATSLADRQFWWREDNIELRNCSRFPAAEQSRKP